MKKSHLPNGSYPMCGLSNPQSATLFIDNDHQWATFKDIEKFRELFKLFKSGKISWKEDKPMAVIEDGFVVRVEF